VEREQGAAGRTNCTEQQSCGPNFPSSALAWGIGVASTLDQCTDGRENISLAGDQLLKQQQLITTRWRVTTQGSDGLHTGCNTTYTTRNT